MNSLHKPEASVKVAPKLTVVLSLPEDYLNRFKRDLAIILIGSILLMWMIIPMVHFLSFCWVGVKITPCRLAIQGCTLVSGVNTMLFRRIPGIFSISLFLKHFYRKKDIYSCWVGIVR